MSIQKYPNSKKLAEALHASSIRLLRAMRRVDDGSGLSAPRLSALSVVVFQGPVTLAELAGAEQVRPPTMTRIVSALEERGLVTKTKDSQDARSIRIAATAKGKRMLLQGRIRRIELLSRKIEAMDASQREQLDRAVKTVEGFVEEFSATTT